MQVLIELKNYRSVISIMNSLMYAPECLVLLDYCQSVHGQVEALHLALLLSTIGAAVWPIVCSTTFLWLLLCY
jgi:hypothetical protein